MESHLFLFVRVLTPAMESSACDAYIGDKTVVMADAVINSFLLSASIVLLTHHQ